MVLCASIALFGTLAIPADAAISVASCEAATIDFDLADESGFIQEDAAQTNFTADGKLVLGADFVVGAPTGGVNSISTGSFSTVSDDLTVPATGVISSWRVFAVTTGPLKLKAYLKNGSNNYTLRGESSSATVNNGLNGPFASNIPVVAGDKIGLFGGNNPYRTTGGTGFFGWTNTDFSGTGAFGNSITGSYSHTNVEFTLTQRSTSQPYYVTTADATQIKTKHWTAVSSVSITQTTPASTSVKYLVSFDDRATWKFWNGSSWAASSLANLQVDGMSKATLEGLSSANWSASGGFTAGTTTSIDLAIDMATTLNTAAPSVDQISFSYTTLADDTLDYATASEGDYIQQDAVSGTDFAADAVKLHLTSGGASGLLSLSGGTGGTVSVPTYTAPNGTTVVGSTPPYPSDPNYRVGYLFSGSVGTATTEYWLTSSTGNQTLKFTFPSAVALDYIRVYPYTRTDAWSQYNIEVSNDDSTYFPVTGGFTHTSIGSAGDNFDYQVDATYKYVRFTLTRQGSWGVTLNEIQFYQNSDTYPLNTGYHVTTSDANQIDVSAWTTLGNVCLAQTTPASTTLKHLVSFDDRATWKYWNSSSWLTSTLGNIGTNGNASSTIEALTYDQWESSGGFQPGTTQTLDFASELKTSNALFTPSLDRITVEYAMDASPPPVASADLSLTKTVDNPIPVIHATVNYTLTVTNVGTDSATGVAVTDLLPPGLTYGSSTPSQGSYSAVTGIWTVGTIASGTSKTLVITTVVADGTGSETITNTAQVSASSVADPDSTPNNDAAAEDDQASAAITVLSADLSVNKIVDDATPSVGGIVIYTVTITNAGPTSTTNVAVEDLLPVGLTFASATSSQGIYIPSSGIWSVGTIAAGAIKTLNLTATVNAGTGGTTITNTAQASNSDIADPDSTQDNDAPAEDDQDSVDIFVQAVVIPPSADLSLTKTVDVASPLIGDTVTYTVTVSNAGPDAATSVKALDILPAGLTYVSDTPSQGTWFYNGGNNNGEWWIGTIASSASATLTIVATVDAATGETTITNTAQVIVSAQADPDSTPNNGNAVEDDQDSVSIYVRGTSDLSLTKTVDVASPLIGDTVTYIVTVSNAGPDAATHVQARDILPAGLTYVSDTPSQGTWFHNGGNDNGEWWINTIASGASATLTIVATVDAATGETTITNMAEVITSDQVDPDSTWNNSDPSEDDQDSVSIYVRGTSDLSLTKTVDDASPSVGETVVYTVTVSNAGPDAANHVQAHDILPAGLTYVSDTPSQGTWFYNGGNDNGKWVIGTIASGASATLTITATVNAGTEGATITNMAQVITSDQVDPDSTWNNSDPSEDDQDSISALILGATVPSSDLSVAKVVDDATPDVGETVTYTVTVSNTGPDSTTNVVVSDLLPGGVTFASATPSQGSYVSGTGIWTVGTIASGAAKTLTITATVNAGTEGMTITNTAEVSDSDLADPDSTPNNGNASEDDQASASLNVASVSEGGGSPPPPPTATEIFNVRALHITETEADILWETNRPASSFVDFGLTNAYGATTSTAGDTHNHSVRLSGLSLGTTYQYRVRSAGGGVPEAVSSAHAFTTLVSSDPTGPYQVVDITSTSARITWNTDEASDSHVDYGLSSSYSDTASGSTLKLAHSVILSDLVSSATYRFRATSTTAAGDENLSAEYRFTTLDMTPPAFSNIFVDRISATTVRVNWTTDEPADPAVRYGLTSAYGSISAAGDDVTSHHVTLTGLASGTTYHFSVSSTDAAGNGTSSADRMFTTASAAPPPSDPPPTPPVTPSEPSTPPAPSEPSASSTEPAPPAGIAAALIGSLTTITQVIVPGAPLTENIANVAKEFAAQAAYAFEYFRTVIITDPRVKRTTTDIIVPAAALVTIAAALTAAPLASLAWYLYFLFTQPFLLLGRRKRKEYGVVYHALTKQPIDLAIVRLYRRSDDKLKANSVTGKQGRYSFLVDPGEYRIEVSKPGLIFPTQILKDRKEDGAYLDLYHGETIRVDKNGANITANIPLDPLDFAKTNRQVMWEEIMRGARSFLGAASVIVTLAAALIYRTPLLLSLLVLQVAVYLIFLRIARPPRLKKWGIVYDERTRKPIPFAVARIIEMRYNKTLDSRLTDSKGRYNFLVGNDRYFVTVEKAGYDPKKTSEIDLSKTGKGEGVVDVDIPMTPDSRTRP